MVTEVFYIMEMIIPQSHPTLILTHKAATNSSVLGTRSGFSIDNVKLLSVIKM